MLARKESESLVIGDTVVQFVRLRSNRAIVRIVAREDVQVLRGEIYRMLVARGSVAPILLGEEVT